MGSLLARIIDEGLITPVYQPLVDLYTGEVLGYEALARGPEGELERPDQLFAAARARGPAGRAGPRLPRARRWPAPTQPDCAAPRRCS